MAVPLSQAKGLLEAFRQELANETLQEKVATLQKKGGIAKQLGMTQIMGQASSKAAASQSLADGWTLQQTIEAVKSNGSDLSLRILAREVEALVKVDAGTYFGLTQDGDPASEPVKPAEPVKTEVEASTSSPSKEPSTSSQSDALSLLEAFISECDNETTQAQLAALAKRGGIAKKLGLTQVMNSAATKIGTKLGLGDGYTVKMMQDSVKSCSGDLPVRLLARAAEDKVGMDAGALFGMTEDGDPQEPGGAPASAVPVEATPSKAEEKKVIKAITVLEAFSDACEDFDFQTKLAALNQKKGITRQLGLAQLMGQASIKAGTSVGMGDELTMNKLQELVKEAADESGIRSAARKAEVTLGMDAGALFGLTEEKEAASAAPEMQTPMSAPAALAPASPAQPPVLIEDPMAAEEGGEEPVIIEKATEEPSPVERAVKEPVPAEKAVEKSAPVKATVSTEEQPDTSRLSVSSHAIDAIHSVVDSLASYELDSAESSLSSMENARMRESLSRLVKNLRSYRPHLPDALLVNKEKEIQKARVELDAMKVSALRKKAVAVGVSEEDLEEADDSSDIKESIVQLILRIKALELDAAAANTNAEQNATVEPVSAAAVTNVKETEAENAIVKAQLMEKDTQLMEKDKMIESLRAQLEEAVEKAAAKKETTVEAEAVKLVEPPPAKSEPPPKVETQETKKEPDQQSGGFTEASAIALQLELKKGFMTEGFQKQLKELQAKQPSMDPGQFTVERANLFMTVQEKILPKYGFAGNNKGIREMMKAMNPMMNNTEIFTNSEDTSWYLGLPTLTPGWEPQEVKAKAKAAANESGVTRKQSQGSVEVRRPSAAGDVEDTGPIKLTQAREIMRGILNAVSDKDITSSAERMHQKHLEKGTPIMQWRGQLGMLFFTAVKDPISKHGFDIGGNTGMQDFFLAIWNYQKDPTVKNVAHDIERKLKVPLGTMFGIQPPNWQPPVLSQARGVELLKNIKGAVESKDFQRGLAESAVQVEPMQFFQLALQNILLSFGFGGDVEAVEHLSNAIRGLGKSAEIKTLCAEIESAARFPSGTFGHSEVENIEVAVKHGVKDDVVKVSIPANATVRDVKAALAKLLGNADVMSSGRLVKKQGSNFSSFKDSEPVGAKREFLFLGADLEVRGGASPVSAAPPPKFSAPAPTGGSSPKASAGSSISLDQALRLQRDLIDGFSKPAWQQKLRQLEAKYDNPGANPKFRAERTTLLLEVQNQVLPKYGFGEGFKAVQLMLKAFDQHQPDFEFQNQGSYLNWLLGLHELNPPGYTPDMYTKGKAAETSDGFPLEKALMLQRDLRKEFMDIEFQKKRLQLEQRYPGDEKNGITFLRERQALFLSVQSQVLPNYGFPADRSGPAKMLQAFFPHNADDIISQQGNELNYLLGIDVDTPSWQPPPFIRDAVQAAVAVVPKVEVAPVAASGPGQAEIEVKHGISGTKVSVRMAVTAKTTLKEVKTALSEKLARPDVQASGRFVKKGGGGFASLKDTELLGDKRALSLLGVDL